MENPSRRERDPDEPLGLTQDQRLQSDISEHLAPWAKEAIANSLPRRQPGTHWTGPSGEHIEVPVTPRTLANVQRWGRTIT